MIISDKHALASNGKKTKIVLFSLLAIVLVFLLYPISYFTKSDNPSPNSYYCDLEVRDGDFFLAGDYKFKSAKTQSSDYSRSGKYSCFLKKSNDAQYGVFFQLPAIQRGESYKASVWRYREEGGDDGYLVVAADDPKQFYIGTNTIIKSVGGWELLEINFTIPYYRPVDNINVYVYSKGAYPVYFDDLLIDRISAPLTFNQEKWAPPQLNIQLKEKALKKLNNKRKAALQNGILESSDDDWVKAKLHNLDTDESHKVQLRLKGDWLDHLKDNKWSFRIKVKTGEAYNRLRYFSLHTPSARLHLHEWVLHKAFEQEGVLTTYYDFLQLDINKESRGVYAIEEHFDKVLLERQKRREGPIIRFSENGYWSGLKRQLKQLEGLDFEVDMINKRPDGAILAPFRSNTLLKDSLLSQQTREAILLLDQYRNGEIAIGDIFDLDLMAKYMALCDAFNAYHGLTWHNQRYYFNPLSSKLEPIGFDGFAELPYSKNFFLGMGAYNSKNAEVKHVEQLFFLDLDFTAKYAHYLYKYTSRSFLNAFFANIEEDLKLRETLIQTEFEDYEFDLERFLINAQRMHSLVLPYDEFSVKVYTQKSDKYTQTIKVGNNHGLPVQLIGTGIDQFGIQDTLDDQLVLEAFFKRKIHDLRSQQDTTVIHPEWGTIIHAYRDQQPVQYKEIVIPKSAEYLFYKPVGIDSVFFTSLADWPLYDRLSIRQKIFKNIELVPNEVYSVAQGIVFFKKGKHRITEPIIIPSGYEVIFEAGCQLDFVKKAKFISQSPVFIRGTEAEPVLIKSSDKSARGFIVLETSRQSKLYYAIFDGFDTLKEPGWTLTGAVTFYKANVHIERSIFRNNVSEDGLNIVNSEFLFKNSQINNAYSDGLDTDFCKGKIENSRFINSGNDGMDFSGSVILVDGALVDGAGDKGISVGEHTDASVFNVNIKNSVIAVASKDLSTLFIDDITMFNCDQGFTAYQKKPEYGGANIIVEKYQADQVKRLYNIREDCTLQLLDKVIMGESLFY